MRTKKRGVDRLLAFRICRCVGVYTCSNLPALLPISNPPPYKTKRTYHGGISSFVGADDGIVTRGANCAPWSFAGKTRPPEEFSTRLLLQILSPLQCKNTPTKSRGAFTWCG